jgi:hypothetical protein
VLWVATTLAIIAVFLLVVKPEWGVPAVFIVRPIVDTTWAEVVYAGLKLTEIFSALVPIFIIVRMCLPGTRSTTFTRMPLRWIWLLWSVDVALFSAHIMFASDIRDGANVLFRHLNGLTGFFMVQAYLAHDRGSKRFLWALAIAGLFPIGMGIVEALTGQHWSTTFGEGGLIRNVGMYHDAITIRYYAMQTILALILLAAVYLHRRFLWTATVAVYSAASAVVVYYAYSKSGALTLASWAVLWPTLLRRRRLLGFVALFGMGFVLAFSTSTQQRLSTVFNKEISVITGDSSKEHSFSGRWYIWRDLLDEWSQLDSTQKIFGAGKPALGAHNDYLQILYHGGYVGLTIYVLLLLAVFWRIALDLLERRDPWSVAALLVFIMWMVDTIGLIPSAYSGYQWFVWGVIGLCARRRANEAAALNKNWGVAKAASNIS